MSEKYFTIYEFTGINPKSNRFEDSIELVSEKDLEYHHAEIHRQFIMDKNLESVVQGEITVRQVSEKVATEWMGL
jgi:hypothetical protein